MRFRPSHLSRGARPNPPRALSTRAAEQRVESEQRKLGLCTLVAQAKARHQQRAAQGLSTAASTTSVTLLTAEEQAQWTQLGGKAVTDALLVAPNGDCDRVVIPEAAPATSPQSAPSTRVAEVPAAKPGSHAATYAIAAAVTAAAFFALR